MTVSGKAVDFKAQGNAAFSAGEFEKAIDCFTSAIGLDAGNHVLYSNRSAAYASLKNYKEALQDAEKTVSLKSDWAKGYSRKGAALFGLGDLENAAKAYEEGLKIDPSSALLKKGLEDVERAMNDSPLSSLGNMFGPDMWTKLASNPKLSPYLSQPDVVAMLQECQKDPKNMSHYMKDQRMMQIMLGLMGLDGAMATTPEEMEKAKQEANENLEARQQQQEAPKAAEPEPVVPEVSDEEMEKQKKRAASDAEKTKGNELYKKRKFEEALVHYDQAWAADNTNVAVLTNKAAVLFEMENFQECIKACELAIETGREIFADFKLIGRALGRIGSAYAKLDDFDNAIKYFNKSLAENRTADILTKLRETEALKAERAKQAYINPELSDAEREKGNAFFKNHEYPESVKCYTEAVKRNPSDPKNFSNRAAAYTKLMALPEAERDCDEAIRLDPTFIKAYIRKAAVQFTKREYSKCVETCNLALEKDVAQKHASEIQGQIQKAQFAMYGGGQTEQSRQDALKNPEVQQILGDPVMQQILRQMQEDPSAIREHMKNAEFAKKMQVLAQMATLTREINILIESTSDRSSKKLALEKLLKHSQGLSSQEMTEFTPTLLASVLKMLVDPIEKCRELSMSILKLISTKADPLYPLLPQLMPLFSARLGQIKIVESSEEIRLDLVKTLNQIVLKTGENFSPFVEDVSLILHRVMCDSFQDIRKESCALIISLTKTVPRALALLGGAIVKLILPSLSHRHSSVRNVALQALGAAMIVDASAIDDSIEPLRLMTRDKAPTVRQHLYTLAKDWLTQLMDRHVHGYKIVPLLYAGLTDEIPNLKQISLEYLDIVGVQYEKEHNDRLKDELDYSDGLDRPSRPRSGSRHLARDNIQKIVGKQVELIGDWNLETRYKAAQVLTVFTDYAETNITGYVGTMLPAIYKLLAGDEQYIMDQTVCLMEKIGQFVKPETTLNLILPSLTTGGGGLSTFRIGCLRALQGVLKGTSSVDLSSHLHNLLATLSDRELVQNESLAVMEELAKCLLFVGQKLSPQSGSLFEFFYILVQLQSFPGDDKVVGWTSLQNTVNLALLEHSKCLGTSLENLYLQHLDQGLQNLSQSFTTWNQYSSEPRTFQTLLFKNSANFGEKLGTFLPIVTECTAAEKDFELRERMHKILLHLFKVGAINKSQLNPFMPTLFKDIVLRSCLWKAGKKPALIRTLATELFVILLNLYTAEEATVFIQPLFTTDVIPSLCSNLDDDEQATRQNCLACISFLFGCKLWDAESIKKVYPELLKRMDDAKDQVRIETANVWALLFPAVQQWISSMSHIRAQLPVEDQDKMTVVQDGVVIELGLDYGHYETIVDGLLIHMDDANHLVQESVCAALVSGKQTVFDPVMIRSKAQGALSKHRSSIYLEKLLS